MSTIVRKRSEPHLADGVYRVVITQVEPGIASRFNARDDLVRIGFDVVTETDGDRPRLWLVATPLLEGRLLALVEAALNRTLTPEEEEGFDLEELVNREVQVVIAGVRTRGDAVYSRIITFLRVDQPSNDR